MPDTPPVTFHQWFASHAAGNSNDEMTATLAEVVQAVTHLGKKGKVVLELEVKPAGSHNRQVFTACTITGKPPVPEPEASIDYVGEGGGLFRDDPYQAKFDDVKDAPADPPVRELDVD